MPAGIQSSRKGRSIYNIGEYEAALKEEAANFLYHEIKEIHSVD